MTPERMDWSDDERLYQPRIHSRRIRALHRIREGMREPMTVLLDQALEEFIGRQNPEGTNVAAEVISSENTTLDGSRRSVERRQGHDPPDSRSAEFAYRDTGEDYRDIGEGSIEIPGK